MKWYYSAEGHATGPVDEQKLAELARSGVVTTDTLIWHSGLAEFEPVWKLKPEIIEHLNKSAMARQAKGATDRIPTQAPPAKEAPAADAKKSEKTVKPSLFGRLFGRK